MVRLDAEGIRRRIHVVAHTLELLLVVVSNTFLMNRFTVCPGSFYMSYLSKWPESFLGSFALQYCTEALLERTAK
jgi:hypothetical protein